MNEDRAGERQVEISILERNVVRSSRQHSKLGVPSGNLSRIRVRFKSNQFDAFTKNVGQRDEIVSAVASDLQYARDLKALHHFAECRLSLLPLHDVTICVRLAEIAT